MKTKTLAQLKSEQKTAQLKHELEMLQNKNRWDYTNETKPEISKFDKAEKQILTVGHFGYLFGRRNHTMYEKTFDIYHVPSFQQPRLP